MSDRVVFNRKYEPLFRPPDTRYTLVKGGRGSGKSVAVNTSLCDRTYDDGYNTLFTRYTMTSAEISIIPEFTDKLEMLGIGGDFKVRSSEITNLASGGKIIFRGLLTSSGNQVAKLKSISKVKRWILDEAQELTGAGHPSLDVQGVLLRHPGGLQRGEGRGEVHRHHLP